MNSLNHRRDDRSEEQFASDISLGTMKENIWGRFLVPHHIKASKNIRIKVEDGTQGRSGELITDNIGEDHDFIYLYVVKKDKIIKNVEIKTADTNIKRFFTVKKGCLRSCLNRKADVIFVNKRWMVNLPHQNIKTILDQYHADIYRGFSPNDPAIRFFHDKNDKNPNEPTIPELFQRQIMSKQQWSKDTQDLIYKYNDILYAPNVQEFMKSIELYPELKEVI